MLRWHVARQGLPESTCPGSFFLELHVIVCLRHGDDSHHELTDQLAQATCDGIEELACEALCEAAIPNSRSSFNIVMS